jgi:hypothetical protein
MKSLQKFFFLFFLLFFLFFFESFLNRRLTNPTSLLFSSKQRKWQGKFLQSPPTNLSRVRKRVTQVKDFVFFGWIDSDYFIIDLEPAQTTKGKEKQKEKQMVAA